MRTTTKQFLAPLILLPAMLLVACGNDESAAQADVQPAANATVTAATSAPAPRPSPLQTDPLVAAPTDAWPTNGGSFYNQRFSPLDEINRDNVSELKAQWRVHLNGSGLETRYSAEGTPVYEDGVLYITTGDSDAFAVDVDSGEMLWA